MCLAVCLQLDLASLSSVRDFVKEFMHRKRKLNVLINNAAMMLSSRDLTPRHTTDGLEVTMAANHFGRSTTAVSQNNISLSSMVFNRERTVH